MTLSRRRTLSITVLVAVVAAVYAMGLNGKFISDDWPMIADNPNLSVDSLPDYFTRGVWENSQFEVSEAKLYRPLYLVWYLVVRSLVGVNAFGFHAAVLFVHLFNTLLVLLLFERLFPTSSPMACVSGALLFALHPAHVQSVAWISGGTDPVAAAFFLGGMLAYTEYLRTHRWPWLGGALALFFAAMLVKEITIVFPVVLLAFDYFQQDRRGLTLLQRRHILSIVLVGIYLAIRGMVVDGIELEITRAGAKRVVEQAAFSVRYALVPFPQFFYFRYPSSGLASWFDLAIGAAGGVALVALGWRRKETRFWLVWSLATVSVTLALGFHAVGVFALRFLYLPVVGLAALLPALERSAFFQRRLGITIVVLTLTGLAASVVAAQQVWRSEGTFYAFVIENAPAEPQGYEGLARYEVRRGKPEAAVAAYRTGLKQVRHPGDRAILLKPLGLLLADMGRHVESLATYRSWNQIAPGSEPLLGIGNNLWVLGRHAAALDAYRTAIAADPNNSLALANLARLSAYLGDTGTARGYYERILALPAASVDPAARQQARAYLGH